MLVGQCDRVADSDRLLQIFFFIGMQQRQIAAQRRIGGIDIAEDLSLGGVQEPLVAIDVELSAQFLALIAVKDAEWKINSYSKVKIDRWIAAYIEAQSRVCGSVRYCQPVVGLRFVNGFNGRTQIRTRV